jgi:hypothetical protein
MALPQIPIGLEYIVLIPTLFIFVIMFLVWFIMDLKKFGYEGFVFRKARKKDLPALQLEDIGTGYTELIVGQKDKKGSPIFKHPKDDSVILVDPTILTATKPAYWGNGLYMHHYASNQYQPLNTINALGLNQVVKVQEQYFPELNFLKKRDLMAFAKMKQDNIHQNVKVVIDAYRPEWDNGDAVTEDEIVQAVIGLQDRLKHTKTAADMPVLWDAAFAMNPVTHQAQDLGELKKLMEMLIRKELEKWFNMWNYVIMAIALLGVVAVVIYVISMAK